MKVEIRKKGSLTFYRFTRADGRIFLVGRTYGKEQKLFIDSSYFQFAPYLLPLDLPLIELVQILNSIEFDLLTLHEQMTGIENKYLQKIDKIL